MQQFVFSISKHHPSLAGHFPGNPVVPAVVMLDELILGVNGVYADLNIQGFKQVKFLQPVVPGEPIEVQLKTTRKGGVSFKGYQDERLMFNGEFICEATIA